MNREKRLSNCRGHTPRPCEITEDFPHHPHSTRAPVDKRLFKSFVQRNWGKKKGKSITTTGFSTRALKSILTTAFRARRARSFNHLHKILFNKRIPKAFIFNAAP